MDAPISKIMQVLKPKPSGEEARAALRIRMRYQLEHIDPLTVRIDPYIEKFRPMLDGTVLDAGCYTGYLYHALGKPQGYVGIDNWPEAIEVAREFAPEATFICADLLTYDLGMFDYVWCAQTIQEGGCDAAAIDRIRAAARKECIFVQTGARQAELNTCKTLFP